MKTKIVPSSWMQLNGLRLDCGPYLSGALEARIRLESLSAPKVPLKSVTKGHNGGIYNGPQFSRNYVDSPAHGVPFVGSSAMLMADLSNLPLLRRKDAESSKLAYLRLQPGMTLISCSGTIGRMVYTRPDMDGMWSSQHVMKVVPDPEKIPPGYLYAYLSSKYGVPQVVSGTYGAIIQHIEPEHIANLPVPRLGKELEEKVHALVEEAASEASQGESNYQKSTQISLKNANLENLEPNVWNQKKNISFISHIDSRLNLRALNHDPRLVDTIKKIKNQKHILIENCLLTPPFRPNRFSRIDTKPGHGTQLIGQREMFQLNWEGRWISLANTGNKNEIIPPTKTIILACIGTLGDQEVYCRAARIRPNQHKFAISDNVLQLRVDKEKISEEYIFSLLRSETYFRMFRCLSTGGKQQVLHPFYLSKIPIPIIDNKKIDEINELVCEGDEKLDSSNSKFKTATDLIESRIDSNNI